MHWALFVAALLLACVAGARQIPLEAYGTGGVAPIPPDPPPVGETDDRSSLYASACPASCIWYDEDAGSPGTGTEASPYNASQRATFVAECDSPGEVCWVAGASITGNEGFAPSGSGTSGNPIVFAGWPTTGRTTVSSPTFPDSAGNFNGSIGMGWQATGEGQDYIRFVGFDIVGTLAVYGNAGNRSVGIEVDNNTFATGSHLFVHGTDPDTTNISELFVQYVTDPNIHDNVFRALNVPWPIPNATTAAGQAISIFHVDGTSAVIEQNDFNDAIDGFTGAINLKDDVDTILIRRNHFFNMNGTAIWGQNQNVGGPWTITENVFECGDRRAVEIVKGIVQGADIHNNTLVDCGEVYSSSMNLEGALKVGAVGGDYGTNGDIRWWANIHYNTTNATGQKRLHLLNECNDSRENPTIFDQNLYSDVGDIEDAWSLNLFGCTFGGENGGNNPPHDAGDWTQTLTQWQIDAAAFGFDAESVESPIDPFLDASGGNYGLIPGSPAIGIACADPTASPALSCVGSSIIDAGALQFGDTTTIIGVR